MVVRVVPQMVIVFVPGRVMDLHKISPEYYNHLPKLSAKLTSESNKLFSLRVKNKVNHFVRFNY